MSDDPRDLIAKITPPGTLGFVPDYLKMSDATKDLFPKRPAPAVERLFGLPVVIDRWVPDGFVAVVGPPKDPGSRDPADWLPQIVFINVTEGGSLDA